MAYLTRSQAVAAARQSAGTVRLAESELRQSATSSSVAVYDIFLSHSIADAEVVFGIKTLLESDGVSVYVDWVDDPQLDRRAVTPTTAARLRARLNQCGYLLYATSESSPSSRWMPWELGYFDGRVGRIGILPLVATAGAGFTGAEYLGLYPWVELADVAGGHRRFGVMSSDRTRLDPLQHLARA
jgi:hypothetical protein